MNFYRSISVDIGKVDIGKENNQQIYILGDFNVKVGNFIINNRKHQKEGET